MGFAGGPGLAEHGAGEGHEGGRGLQLLDERADIAFELVALDGLAVGVATFGVAQVVRVAFPMTACREAGPQRRVAAAAQGDAAQGEGVADIGALGGLGDAVAAILDLLVGFERDQRLVLGFEPG
ncbi:hypothetical protein N9W17_03965 [Jannaschia sp.]|nr:hypothetical protein [Jannaschia sp.]